MDLSATRAKSYELHDADFEKISRFVYDLCGINLHDGKRELVKARLNKRLKEGNFPSFSEYLRHVTTQEGTEELTAMIDSLSTNLTSFFREESHFHALREIVAARVKAGLLLPGGVRLKLWSAGCSTGEEPYTMAMVLHSVLQGCRSDVKILATDISTKVLKQAVAGVYQEKGIARIPQAMLRAYFQQGTGKWKGQYRAKDVLRQMIHFARFNLKDPISFNEGFDIIFCRNVMIYFDKETQRVLINRFYDCLKDGGYLFVGHSESLTGLAHRFRYIEPSVYRK